MAATVVREEHGHAHEHEHGRGHVREDGTGTCQEEDHRRTHPAHAIVSSRREQRPVEADEDTRLRLLLGRRTRNVRSSIRRALGQPLPLALGLPLPLAPALGLLLLLLLRPAVR